MGLVFYGDHTLHSFIDSGILFPAVFSLDVLIWEVPWWDGGFPFEEKVSFTPNIGMRDWGDDCL